MSDAGRGELPEDVSLVRTTAVFDEESVPTGLLRAHRIATGVWGRLVVRTGSLGFRFEDHDEPMPVLAGDTVVIPPDRPHHVVIDGPVRFVIEFHQ